MSNDNQFLVATTSLVLSVPPIFSGNPKGGVEEMLDSMIMRYVPALQGVVLSHSNLKFLNKSATIRGDSPFLVCTIAFDATVWSPRVGIKLLGKVNLCSPDHISLLVHRTFNVSIPRCHIPTEDWEFEYGAAENDPEFGHGQGGDESAEEMNENSGGKWVHRVTGESLANQVVEFTVIGLTVANEMLSLLGSLQAEPFSAIYKSVKAHSEIPSEGDEPSSSEDTFEPLEKMYEAKRKTSRSQERTDSEKKTRRK
ncbi:hypothetical protein BYT27DRAFT_7180331 [Phlegmacium glaucopus]|nr:hypothetical protein BYT27DRAFT_7180331 [Phlegmacium glaucopus]